MRRNFKLVLSIIVVLLSGALAFSQEKQEKVEYKDVVLDGKPAKLNIATGEIIFVNPNDKKKPVKLDDYAAKSEEEAKETVAPELDSNYHIVQEKETLLDIANRYNTSLTELKRVNNLQSTLVDKGQKLRVKNFEDLEYTLVDSPSPLLVSVKKGNFHIVEKGQTLYSLANRYGLSVNELKQQNGLTSNLIMIGQKLQVANFDLVEEDKNLSVWIVSKGDTLYSIARKNGTTVDELKSLNELSSNLILVGQKLKLK